MSSFCKCKSYSHFFSKNISIYGIFNDQSFNDMLTNDIVSFEQLGPGLQSQKTYLLTCAPSEDSDQPAHSRSLIRIFTERILDSQGCKVSSCGQKTLIRLHGCAGCFESSFGAHVRRYVFSNCGSSWHHELTSKLLSSCGLDHAKGAF